MNMRLALFAFGQRRNFLGHIINLNLLSAAARDQAKTKRCQQRAFAMQAPKWQLLHIHFVVLIPAQGKRLERV